MTRLQRTGDGLTKGVRWSARLVGLLAASLFLEFIMRKGAKIVPGLSWSSPIGMPLFVALVMAVAGGLIGWRWEAIGGTMAVVGAVAFVALAYIGLGPGIVPAALMLTLPLFVAGFLYLACCWRTRKRAWGKKDYSHAAQTLQHGAGTHRGQSFVGTGEDHPHFVCRIGDNNQYAPISHHIP